LRANRPRLTLYGRRDCHLCEQMHAALEQLRDVSDFELIEVDVDNDAELARRYGNLVPVLTADETLICYYTLSHAALTAYLESFR
jgi:glutaredoxin